MVSGYIEKMLIHDTVSGLKAAERKEDLQKAVEEEIEVGGAGLDKQDRYLLEINLEDLETSSGEDQYYWLVEIRSARVDRIPRRRQQERDTKKNEGEEDRHKNLSRSCYMQEVRTLDGPYFPGAILDEGESPLLPWF